MFILLVQYYTCYYNLLMLGKLKFLDNNENTLLHILLASPVEVKMLLLKCLTGSWHPNYLL